MVKVICIVCGGSFESVRTTKKYCSIECESKFRYQNSKSDFLLICECCDKEFKSSKKTAKYCSIVCSNKNRQLKENRDNHLNICEICGVEFKSIFKEKRFCSEKCNRKFRYLEELKILIKYTCEWCKSVFERPKSFKETRFCSNSCSKFAMHANMSEQEKENWKNKISESNTGNIFTPERKEQYRKMFSGGGNPRFGVPVSDKIKNKIAESLSKTISEKIVKGEFLSWFEKGKIFSNKMKKEVVYRSSWEKTVYEFLDQNEEVIEFSVEPFYIPYLFEGLTKHYIPDVLITYKNGIQKLVEIKPSVFINYSINQSKFSAAFEYCQSKCILFEVWDENIINNLLIEN